MRLCAIVARSRNNVIGKDNDLPWHIPEDMKWFKKSTMGKPVIMGRKTWESLPRLLPGRQNIILTRDVGLQVAGADVVQDLGQALSCIIGNPEEAMIIGGAEIYKLALDRLDRLYLTVVDADFDGDTFFPKLDLSKWHEIFREDHCGKKKDGGADKSAPAYSFMILERA